MDAQEMWNLFSAKCNVYADYQTWQFGADPDELAYRVLTGVKTATASAYCWYEPDNSELPKVGDYSVVLNARDEAVCIIRTTSVSIAAFDEVSAEHACKEGEGDRSLQYWRQAHEDFFTKELTEAGLLFSPRMPVVCEEFVRVFP